MSDHRSAIKKNIIDLLMFSLYADAKTIYREYVQNALDAINRAVNEGILEKVKDGVVNITINKNKRTISIRDNGCGISVNEAPTRLLDISASSKDGITAAGQFGIGRLVGGGYCHKLVFKTSAQGEDKATIVTFDVDAIWNMVKDDPTDYLATYVIDCCTTVEQVLEERACHYFEVNLYDVKSGNATVLLDKTEIVRYLNEIAPVEYKTEFSTYLIHKSTLSQSEYKELHYGLPKVQLFVNNTRIQKQYGLTVSGSKGDKISNLEYFRIEDPKFGLLGWGWFALTKFSVQIDKADALSGIRLRKHNIQIGDFNLLSGKPLWREERGNSYFYGEIFITHKNLLPNAARDGLAPTAEKEALYIHLADYFKKLSEIYVKANQAKKAIDKILAGADRINADKKVDRVALDLIENKGNAVFKKLIGNAQNRSLQRMLQLYQPEFEDARHKAECAKAAIAHRIELNSDQTQESDLASGKSKIESKYPLGPQEHLGEISAFTENEFSKGNDQGQSNLSSVQKKNALTGDLDSKDKIEITLEDDNNETIRKEISSPSDPHPIIPYDVVEISLKPSLSPQLKKKDIIKPLESILDENEIWLLRRVFKVLNTYCPNNERDQRLISSLEMQIVNELKNDQ